MLALGWGWTALSALVLIRIRRRRLPAPARIEGVSVLKPLAGVDDTLEQNLETFFVQSYPDYELIFGVQSPDDPALRVARDLRARYPHVRARIVVHDACALNPKVSNLRVMLTAAEHDLIAISDSNVAVERDWLAELQAVHARPGVGLACNLIAGTGERSLGAALDNLALHALVAPGMAVPTELFEHPAVVGKSTLFRRSTFERIGGFESVSNVLAEDYVIGRMFHAAGYKVCLAPSPVRALSVSTTVPAFVRRHMRWAMLRLRLAPLSYALEPLTNPLTAALCAPLLHVPFAPALALALILSCLRHALLTLLLRGPRDLAPVFLLGPLCELLLLASWAAAPFRRHVQWRGQRLRVGAGTRLYAETPLPISHQLWIEH